MKNGNQLRLTRNELTTLFGRSLLSDRLDREVRDLDRDCGYPVVISQQNYQDMYDRHDYAARVVSAYPQECWSTEFELFESEASRNTAFETAWQELTGDSELALIDQLARLDEVSGIHRYGCLLLGVDDAKPLDTRLAGVGEDGQSVPSERREQRLLYTRVFTELDCRVDSINPDPSSPRFGRPQTYLIRLADVSATGKEVIVDHKVHWSRVLHFADNTVSSPTYGVPRMRDVFNRLLDIRKVLGSSAEMFWQGAFPGFTFTVDPSLVGQSDMDRTSVKTEVANYRNSLDRLLAVEGGTFDSLAPQVTDPTNTLTQQITAVCATKQIPLRIFLGTEAGHLASTQDVRTWNRRLKKRQNGVITGRILLPLADRLVMCGVLPPNRKPVKSNWSDLAALSELERADVGLKRTQAVMQYVTGRVYLVMDFLTYLVHCLDYPVRDARTLVDENKVLLDQLRTAVEQGKDPLSPEPAGGPMGGGRTGDVSRPTGRPVGSL